MTSIIPYITIILSILAPLIVFQKANEAKHANKWKELILPLEKRIDHYACQIKNVSMDSMEFPIKDLEGKMHSLAGASMVISGIDELMNDMDTFHERLKDPTTEQILWISRNESRLIYMRMVCRDMYERIIKLYEKEK
jgi:hypothetical protein